MKPLLLPLSLFLLLTALSASAQTAPQPPDNWPAFRGPTGMGATIHRNLPLTWGPAAESDPTRAKPNNLLWTAPLKGQGHASPIVWDNNVIVCNVTWPLPVKDTIPPHHVACYNAPDGKLLWDTLIPPGPWKRTDFRSGPGGGYAAPTPTTDGKLIYCAFGSSVLAALDFQGHIVWRNEIIPYTFDVTLASSPILYDDTLILLCAMAKKEDSKVIAFDKSTGKIKWQEKLIDTGFAHSTPLIIHVNDKPQMLIAAGGMGQADNALQSLNPANGKRLWWCRGQGDVSSPVFGAGLVYFDGGRGGSGWTVDPTGSDDVSKTHLRATFPVAGEAMGSPILFDKYVYRLIKPSTLQCFELATGKTLYSQHLPGIGSPWASPIIDPLGRIFLATAGKSYVVQAGAEFHLLAANDLADPNHASPAVAHDRLLLLGANNLYCIAAPQ